MKTVMGLTVTLGLAFLWSSASALAQFHYVMRNGAIIITGYSGPDSAVTIPRTIDGLPVTGLEGGVLDAASIMIPDTVTSIESGAVSWYTVTEITVDPLNPSYSSVDGVLFDKNQTVLIQHPPARVGAYTVPDTVTRIREAAFRGSVGLTEVRIPDSVLNIGYGAFSSCRSLTNAIIGDGVTRIEADAFSNCDRLTSVIIGNNVAKIEVDTFAYCPSLTSVTIGNSVTVIEAWAFLSCHSLAGIAIPKGVTTIGYRAFFACYNLTNVTFPKSITSLVGGAFHGCPGLTEVYFEGDAPAIVQPASGPSPVFSEFTTVFHLPGTTGWGATYGGSPTALWVLPYPVILTVSSSPRIETNGLGFLISWATNSCVVVEASIDLANAEWSPVATNNFVGGTSYFSDPHWPEYPRRFYRVR